MREYEAGTIVIDLVDSHTQKVVWRGWAQDAVAGMLADQDKMAEKIREAVTRMLARLPARCRPALLTRHGESELTRRACPPFQEKTMSSQFRLAALGTGMLVALAMVACAPAIHVNSYVERGADLGRYRTFDFAPPDNLPTGDPRLDSNPIFAQRVQSALEAQLVAKGYARNAGGKSDFRIHFHASVTQQIDVNDLDRQNGYCTGSDCRALRVPTPARCWSIWWMRARTNWSGEVGPRAVSMASWIIRAGWSNASTGP